ncbi:hypothetical protein HAX54_003256 [Datura stramonium]|uniref:Sugar phosphate transporter domain-containing protein n=1 Tax=Datura stramonium TaxID=4076 RepID=A0ABS8WVS3_DATST|nr:hypothetical protein [Datura stramonium]
MEESRLCQWTVIRSVLAILQWWGFNVTVIIMNKWIFQAVISCSPECNYEVSLSVLILLQQSVGFLWSCPPSFIVLLVEKHHNNQKMDFKFPLTVSCIHFICSAIGAYTTILAESLLHGYKFDSINTVYYMAPFATMILALPALLLEGSGIVAWLQTDPPLLSSFFIIFGSGVLAFCLNFSIFYVIHSTTAVTFNVAGNLKVAVAVTCSWLIFENPTQYQ